MQSPGKAPDLFADRMLKNLHNNNKQINYETLEDIICFCHFFSPVSSFFYKNKTVVWLIWILNKISQYEWNVKREISSRMICPILRVIRRSRKLLSTGYCATHDLMLFLYNGSIRWHLPDSHRSAHCSKTGSVLFRERLTPSAFSLPCPDTCYFLSSLLDIIIYKYN